MQRKHVIITGTGRAGTTFLVQILTRVGLDTGFSPDDISLRINKDARAGLEHDIKLPNCPYIVKNPWFCDYAEEVLSRKDIIIEHVFIPIRDLNAAAESRRYVVNKSALNLSPYRKFKHMIKPRSFPGGLWHTSSLKPGIQEAILLRQLYKLMLSISNTSLPVTFMRYPRIVKDCEYLFEKLKPVLSNITYELFHEAFLKTVRPELIHSFNKKDF